MYLAFRVGSRLVERHTRIPRGVSTAGEPVKLQYIFCTCSRRDVVRAKFCKLRPPNLRISITARTRRRCQCLVCRGTPLAPVGFPWKCAPRFTMYKTAQRARIAKLVRRWNRSPAFTFVTLLHCNIVTCTCTYVYHNQGFYGGILSQGGEGQGGRSRGFTQRDFAQGERQGRQV